MPRTGMFDVHRGRPAHLWGLPGCGPYALVLTALCVVLFIAGILRGDPAAIVIGVALALLFVPLAVIAFLARRQDAWIDQVPIWDDEPSQTPDASNAPDVNDRPARDEAPRHEVP